MFKMSKDTIAAKLISARNASKDADATLGKLIREGAPTAEVEKARAVATEAVIAISRLENLLQGL